MDEEKEHLLKFYSYGGCVNIIKDKAGFLNRLYQLIPN